MDCVGIIDTAQISLIYMHYKTLIISENKHTHLTGAYFGLVARSTNQFSHHRLDNMLGPRRDETGNFPKKYARLSRRNKVEILHTKIC